MAITFSPATPVAFGKVVIGHPAQQPVTITNSGNSDVTLSVTGSVFSALPNPFTVPARANSQDGSISATISFNPDGTKTYTGSISGGGSTLSLTGEGVPVLFAPPGLDFGNVALGSTPTKTLTIKNEGSTAVTITAPTGPFAWSPSATSIAKGSSAVVTITYTPVLGASTGSIAGASSSGSCALTGTGVSLVYSPSSIDFGSVDKNTSTTQTVVITNPTSGPVTITAPSAPFTWDASSSTTTIPANGSTSIVVTFKPTNVRSYASSIAGGGTSCALAGSGRGASDQFETEGDSTDTDATGGSPGTAGNKYYEILVPNFALNSSDSTPGTSFLRIGNFNPSPPTSTGSGLTGEGKSWQLANLVGDPQAIQSAEPQQDLAPDANPTTPSYNGDPNYLLGFCDDTRYRQGDSASAWIARRDETKKLLTKGGWWDHSDGNRISTTAGDKIEVIQGNYKMLVLGRLDSSSDAGTIGANALITDISGGLMAENGPSPTHCIKSIEFSQSERGTWEVYQNNGVGHVYSSFYGDTVDIFLGPHKATWTGDATGYAPDGAGDLEVLNVYKKSAEIRKTLHELTTEVNPAVLDHMFASRVLDYKRVDGDIKSDVQANNIWSKTYAKFDGSGAGGQIQSDTIANTITSTTTAAAITSTNFALNNFAFTFGIQEAINIGAILDVQLGPKSSINIDWMQFNGLKHVVSIENAESAAAEQRLVAIEDDINGIWTDLTAIETRINEVHTELSEETTALSNDTVHLGVTYEAIFAEVDIM